METPALADGADAGVRLVAVVDAALATRPAIFAAGVLAGITVARWRPGGARD